MLQRRLKKHEQVRKSKQESEEWRAKRKKNTNIVFVKILRAVSQMHFLPLLHILLGHPVTSSVPFATEVFVKKVKITEQIVYVVCSLVKV